MELRLSGLSESVCCVKHCVSPAQDGGGTGEQELGGTSNLFMKNKETGTHKSLEHEHEKVAVSRG